MIKFGQKNSKLSVLPENWHKWYLGGADSDSGLKCSKFRPQKSIFRNIWTKKVKVVRFACGILEKLILHPYLYFQNSDSKLHFWANLGRKSQICPFCLKIIYRVFRRCWFLFWHFLLFLFPTLNSFLGKFGIRNSKLSVLPENWHTHSISRMRILNWTLVFSNFKPKSWDAESYSEIIFLKFQT